MTLGLPGTGLSYVKTKSGRSTADDRESAIGKAPVSFEGRPPSRGFAAFLVIAAVSLMAIVVAVVL
jgi:hypothetical protein